MGKGDDSPPRRRGSGRKSDRKSSDRSSGDDSQGKHASRKSSGGGDGKAGAALAKEARSRRQSSGREKGIRESTSWRSSGGDWGLAPLEGGAVDGSVEAPEVDPSSPRRSLVSSPHVERSPGAGRVPAVPAVDSAELEAALAKLCTDA